ncbi:MAG: hypothetical protein KatS3mg017_0550 [Fimbriimonadales bacterium]|nr:MAG: hypothetical protein KatS3mg017_0550 [Fimbriimonadales bacterium]
MRWLVAVLVGCGIVLHGLPQQQGGQVQFGRVKINYTTLVSVRRLKDELITIEVRGRRDVPVRLESPDQYFTLHCASLKATLAPNERNQLVVRDAEATGGVTFRYDRAKPLSRMDGTAQRVRYDGQRQTVMMEGDVSLDGEDEFYRMRWRNNEQIVVYLEEESQRVEAKAKQRDGQPIGEMVIEPKRPRESP